MILRRTRTYLGTLAVAALSGGSAMAAVATYTPTAVAGGTWADALTTPSSYVEAAQFQTASLNNPTLYADTYGTFFAWGSAVGINDATFTVLTINGTRISSAQNPTLNIAAPDGGINASLLWLGANALSSGQLSPEALTITLTDVNGGTTTYNLTTGATSPAFFGFTSDTAINTMTIAAPSGYDVDLLDFYAGNYTSQDAPSDPAPECATLLLVGGGLIVLGARRKFIGPLAC